MIIGLTSFLAAGKDTVGKILEEKGFQRHSCSDYLREVAKERNIEITRDNLVKLGTELREEHGADFLARKIIEKINKSSNELFVIESIRNLGEIKTFKKELKKFNLVFVDASPEIRYKRAKKRLKENEHIDSFEEFMASEKKEMNDKNPFAQQLHKCKKNSDYTLSNNQDLESLKESLSSILVKIQIKDNVRPDWHRYFLNIAKEVSTRSNCLSAHGGAVIVRDNTIVSTGYNGSPRKTKDCYQKGYCLRRKLKIPSGQRYEICSSVCAEQNAIINAAREGVSIKGSTMYFLSYRTYEGIIKPNNSYPCLICKKIIMNSGIDRFIGQKSDGTYKIYKVSDWIKNWNEKDMLDDDEKYNTNYD